VTARPGGPLPFGGVAARDGQPSKTTSSTRSPIDPSGSLRRARAAGRETPATRSFGSDEEAPYFQPLGAGEGLRARTRHKRAAPAPRRRSAAAAEPPRGLRADTSPLLGAGWTVIAPAMVGPLPPHFGGRRAHRFGGVTSVARSRRWRRNHRASARRNVPRPRQREPGRPRRAASAAT